MDEENPSVRPTDNIRICPTCRDENDGNDEFGGYCQKEPCIYMRRRTPTSPPPRLSSMAPQPTTPPPPLGPIYSSSIPQPAVLELINPEMIRQKKRDQTREARKKRVDSGVHTIAESVGATLRHPTSDIGRLAGEYQHARNEESSGAEKPPSSPTTARPGQQRPRHPLPLPREEPADATERAPPPFTEVPEAQGGRTASGTQPKYEGAEDPGVPTPRSTGKYRGGSKR